MKPGKDFIDPLERMAQSRAARTGVTWERAKQKARETKPKATTHVVVDLGLGSLMRGWQSAYRDRVYVDAIAVSMSHVHISLIIDAPYSKRERIGAEIEWTTGRTVA